jgi:hypothetical protein
MFAKLPLLVTFSFGSVDKSLDRAMIDLRLIN